VEDGALVRYLDGQAANGERADVAAHLAGCGRCADRMAELARATGAVTAALRAADPAVPRGRVRPRWGLRAAAAVLVLAAVGGAVRPVRAWILERAGALWEVVTGRGDPGGRPGRQGPASSASVAFVPTGDVFALEVTERQQGGVLQIETVDGDTAVAVVLGGTGREDLVVLPSGLRIVTGPTAGASYVIRVPARLASVRVVLGDEEPRDYRPGGPPVEIPLGRR
jgi:anti-sigma factor RsiW